MMSSTLTCIICQGNNFCADASQCSFPPHSHAAQLLDGSQYFLLSVCFIINEKHGGKRAVYHIHGETQGS